MSDLIKREDAIKALRKLGHEVVAIDKVCSLGVAAEFIDAIRAIPSADRPQGEWTYCSERMPAEAGAYLCLTEIPTVIAYRRIKIGVYHDINGWMLDDVIAWMPLPKLWEGADDER